MTATVYFIWREAAFKLRISNGRDSLGFYVRMLYYASKLACLEHIHDLVVVWIALLKWILIIKNAFTLCWANVRLSCAFHGRPDNYCIRQWHNDSKEDTVPQKNSWDIYASHVAYTNSYDYHSCSMRISAMPSMQTIKHSEFLHNR